jgi:hypothetical protein
VAVVALVLAVVISGLLETVGRSPLTVVTLAAHISTTTASPNIAAAPTTPPVTWCKSGFVDPYTAAPKGAIVVPAGSNAALFAYSLPPAKTYWFAHGSHTLGSGEYAQIKPSNNDRFIGARGAVLDGQDANDTAFSGQASDVTIEYLTVEHFTAPEGQMVVNHDGGADWTIAYNTVKDNPDGAGVGLASGTVVRDNCLTDNGEYGWSALPPGSLAPASANPLTGGAQNITLAGNEVSDNDSALLYDNPNGSGIQCGCSGGGKLWMTEGAVISGNYFHNNAGVAIWVDTNNTGTAITGNYIAHNTGEGVTEETSYNFAIKDNTFVGNAIVDGRKLQGFPDIAIYISESGGDSRVPGPLSGKAMITGNVLRNNWGGVALWENSNRFCSDSSDDACTLVDRAVFTQSSCRANLPTARLNTTTGSPPADYYDGCRWKTQNVQVTHNTFTYSRAAVGSSCTLRRLCGFNGVFSNYGSSAPYSKFATSNEIAFDQRNIFKDNAYSGPWSFWGWNQSNRVTWRQWQARVTDKCLKPKERNTSTCRSGFGQDKGSTRG